MLDATTRDRVREVADRLGMDMSMAVQYLLLERFETIDMERASVARSNPAAAPSPNHSNVKTR